MSPALSNCCWGMNGSNVVVCEVLWKSLNRPGTNSFISVVQSEVAASFVLAGGLGVGVDA